MSRIVNMFGTKGQIDTTRALIKFCREHGHNPLWVERLDQLAKFLEVGDKEQFFEHYKIFQGAGMGCFSDWFPNVSFKHETEDYIQVIWWALLGHWHEQISYAENS